MRWVVLFPILAFPNLGEAQDLETIKQEAAECRQHIAELGYGWGPPWDCRDEPAQSLNQALEYGLEFWGSDNPGYGMGNNNPACEVLIDAGLKDCNYNVRIVLVGFLAMYGVDLFPTDSDWSWGPGVTSYSGKAEENEVLVEVIRRNEDLFADGDLTAEEVMSWH